MGRLLRAVLPIGLVLVFVSQGTAHAGANVNVTINPTPSPGSYSPNPAQTPNPGSTVAWTNNTTLNHSATGDGPLNFWDTGVHPNGPVGSKTFNVAGNYPYHCTVHSSMHGTVSVKVFVSPTSGTVNSTLFTIRWADPSIPSGYNADIQVRRNGGAWMTVLQNRTGTQVQAQAMVPNAGTYDVRARIQNSSSGAASGYSQPATIVVS